MPGKRASACRASCIRDNVLAVSGLLSSKIGGPSVKPHQPLGYWALIQGFPEREWKKDSGENQYRRGLYTYWQRSFLHPSFLAFDAPPREECTVERPRSNTPQQALVLLNDPTYVEAARVFAQRIIHKGGARRQVAASNTPSARLCSAGPSRRTDDSGGPRPAALAAVSGRSESSSSVARHRRQPSPRDGSGRAGSMDKCSTCDHQFT